MEKIKKVTKTLATIGLAGGILLSSVGTGTASASGVHYKDVKKSDNFYNSVEYLLDSNAISKTLPLYHPYDNITRGQFASIFAKMIGLDVYGVDNPRFTDVPTTHQFYRYVAALENEGILDGYPDASFGINDKLTRGQMSGILIKAFGLPKIDRDNYVSEMTDYTNPKKPITHTNDILVDKNRYGIQFVGGQWDDEMATLDSFDIIGGYSDGNMYPNKPINRSQFANMLYKVKQLGVSDYFYTDDDELIYETIEHPIVQNAKESLNEFFEEGGLVKVVKAYRTGWDDSTYPRFGHKYVLNPIKEGEYTSKDGKVKFVLKQVNGEWKLTAEKMEKPKVDEHPTTTEDTTTVTEEPTTTTETE
ncbi:S-layer homology domain-containing protein [Ureibacillus composti]|nr:S-layer homology domain-containing protein [Ureibacillus composti]